MHRVDIPMGALTLLQTIMIPKQAWMMVRVIGKGVIKKKRPTMIPKQPETHSTCVHQSVVMENSNERMGLERQHQAIKSDMEMRNVTMERKTEMIKDAAVPVDFNHQTIVLSIQRIHEKNSMAGMTRCVGSAIVSEIS